MEVKLVAVAGIDSSKSVALKLPAVIGRGEDASVRLMHPLVSRRHCEIVQADGVLRVRDLGSLNGTLIGERRITEADLKPGQLITIGPVTFRAVYGNVAKPLDKPLDKSLDDAVTGAGDTTVMDVAPTETTRDQEAVGATQPMAVAAATEDDDFLLSLGLADESSAPAAANQSSAEDAQWDDFLAELK